MSSAFFVCLSYILQTKETVTLDEELRFVDDYFGLLQVRYGECLQLKTEINFAFRNYSVVPLGLQILIENAVKHNIVSRQYPLCITIETTIDRELIVSNSISLNRCQVLELALVWQTYPNDIC